ncbi:T9SS type A sorting domain-containing protein [Chryseobacterium glaciei]|uniref:T9SS type A sorting domain-containing protein n=1 Tax=Chryseobacterium glaciei TaxID=1685010 RepID=UPI0009EF66B6
MYVGAKIYSLNGALIKTVVKVEDKTAINVSDLLSGVYILKINNESQGIKLIKK